MEVGCIELAEGCPPHVCQLTPGVALYVDVACSPDGMRLAHSPRPGPDPQVPFEVWVMNADGTGQTRLTPIGDVESAWSPDSITIAFTPQVTGEQWGVPPGESNGLICGNVFLMNADGSGVRRLTSALPDSGQPAWASDGRRIALISFEGQDPADGDKFSQIHVMNLDGTDLRRITGGDVHGLGARFYSSWSNLRAAPQD